MLYAFRWKQEAWVKVGWGKDPMQRASDGWWESSHPTTERYGEHGLCGKLAQPHCELIGLWECNDEAEEKHCTSSLVKASSSAQTATMNFTKRRSGQRFSASFARGSGPCRCPPETTPFSGSRQDEEGMLRRAQLLVQALREDV